jgi:hypothetical protein
MPPARLAARQHGPEALPEAALGSGLGDEHADEPDHVVFASRMSRWKVRKCGASWYREGNCSPRTACGAGLDRNQALAHSWMNAFREVTDFILLNEQTVRHHVDHRTSGQSDA